MADLIGSTTQEFVDGMEKSGRFAARQIIALIREMDQQDGNLIYTDRNQQLVDGVSLGIAQVAVSGAFSQRVRKVINSIPKIRKETERSFIVQNGIIPTEAIARGDEMEREVTAFLEQSLGEEVIINEVIAPVLEVLNGMMTANISTDQAIKLANEKVPSLFTQYAHTRVETSLQMYARAINQMLAELKGIEWFFIDGPRGETALGNPMREWCRGNVGGYYLKQEIESWGNDVWEGQLPNTNSITIFQNWGGYNCRHEPRPIPGNKVPKKWKQRARRMGLI